MAEISIDVILADNTRPACGGPQLIRYSAAGVFLALAKHGWDVHWVDLISDKKWDSSAVSQEKPADVCCYAIFFGNKVTAFRHMEKVRRAPKTPRLIIAFGLFASAFPGEILRRGLADVVVVGDPEFVIPAVLCEINNKSAWRNIPNLSYQHEGEVVHTTKNFSHDLDTIPFISPYLCTHGYRPAFTMTARGCQYHCVFCDRNALWGGGIRQRRIDNVLREIEELVNIHRVRQIEFLDEDLAAEHKRLVSLCQGLRHLKGNFFWECSACVDSVTREILGVMGRSGCRAIYFGVESGSPHVLRRIGKMYGRQEILNAVGWAQEACLKVEVMLTIGNPCETDRDRDITLSLLNEIGDGVTVGTNRLVILPGTALYRQGLREGWFTQKSYFEEEGLIFYDESNRMQNK